MKLNGLFKVGGIIACISYFAGNFCLFSYLNSTGATVPFDATFWLNASILVFIATVAIWIPLGSLVWLVFFLHGIFLAFYSF